MLGGTRGEEFVPAAAIVGGDTRAGEQRHVLAGKLGRTQRSAVLPE